jgi:cellulose synthase/poly-beta-1,6-N-acetylglucosamine synthase-like glycosyltransferase
MNLLLRAVTGFLLLKMGVLLLNIRQFPVLGRGREADPGVTPTATGAQAQAPASRAASPSPSVSVLVPVRNEAGTLRVSVPGLLRQQADELIMLDDESTDGTRHLARALLAAHPRARVVTGSPMPPGWVGKTWACHQLAAEATGSLLVFCDADVVLADGVLDAVITEMHAQHADVFSVFPRQVTATLGEFLITPLIDDVLLCFLPFGLLSLPVPLAATANGSLLAFTRQAYDALGGFAAVRGDIIEDVAIARRVRKAGLKLGLSLGGEMVATRMYEGYREVVAGMSRGLLPVTGGSRTRLVLGTGWHLLAYTLPWGMAVRRPLWILPLILGVAERALVDIKTRRGTGWQAALTPLSPLAAVPVIVQALWASQRWKGRVFS